MIGILCERNKKNIYSKKVNKLINLNFNSKTNLNKTDWSKANSFIVFSASDLDLTQKTVTGILITQSEIKPATMPIPNSIFNFLSKGKGAKKKIKALAEQTDIILINEVNYFNQDMIMQMLSSSDITKGFVPSYSVCETDNAISLDIIRQNETPAVLTLHAVRGKSSKWHVLPLSIPAPEGGPDTELTQILYHSALETASCVGNFISSLAFCTIKLVLDDTHSPFLTHFSGWDSSLLLKKQQPDVLNLFTVCFLGYSNLLLNSKRENKFENTR
jgi:hypothetical protein